MNSWMRKFGEWFGSPEGVIETFILTTIWFAIEQVFPNLDPQHFYFMYLMTLYSTQTQSILAYASNVSSEEAARIQSEFQKLQQKQIRMEKSQTQMMKNQTNMMKAILAIAERMEASVKEIAEDVDDIKEGGNNESH